MIKDRLNKKIIAGLNYLVNTDFSSVEDGRHELNDDIYVNIQTYTTKDDALFEAHKDYIDIQYVISGEEKIGVTNYSECKPNIPYDNQKDIEFLDGEGEYYPLKSGEYMVLYPTDAHKPSITLNKKTTVRKAVVKVRI
jgi:YhcH/YjgK/YiaL family protein